MTHLLNLTFWDDFYAIKRFAGEDHDRASYYDFDAVGIVKSANCGIAESERAGGRLSGSMWY
jgi:hypothetical protein